MENREQQGKEETLLEDSEGSICECIYTSRTSQDFGYLILSYDEFALRAPSSRSLGTGAVFLKLLVNVRNDII